MGVSYTVKAVVPKTWIPVPPAPFTANCLPWEMCRPWSAAHFDVTKVKEAPVSSIIWPLVGEGLVSSHLDEVTPAGWTATSMWG